MSVHRAQIRWKRASPDFRYDTYNRAHEMRFKNGGVILSASAAAEFRGDDDRVDPEEAYVASLSSCHMLSFLAICARKRLVVDSYDDDAEGRLEKGAGGKLWVSHVTLRPRVHFAAGSDVDAKLLSEIHHKSHEECFIANSVKTEVAVEPQF